MPDKRRSEVRSQRSEIRVLFFGDVVGKIGRRAVAAVLPSLKRRFRPQLVIANAENLAHGLGVTEDSLNDLRRAGVQFFTSGNNIWSKDGARLLASEPDLIRPSNYPTGVPGRGSALLEIDSFRILVINLQGRVAMHQQLDDPLTTFDRVMKAEQRKRPQAVLVDMHGEVTSEKAALAWYADGRASAVVGTHTHIQTADARLLPKGTAFITDVGMCGARDSIIGTDRDEVMRSQLTQLPLKHVIPEHGGAIVNGLFLEINPRTRKAVTCQSIREIVSILSGGKAVVRKGVRT